MQRGRTLFLRVIVAVLLLIVSGRLAYFQTVKAGEILEEGDRVTRRNLMPLRGTIVDRNGNELARSVPKRTVEAYPRMISEKRLKETAEKLAPLLDMDPQGLEDLLRQHKDSWWIKLKSDLSIGVGQAVEALGLEGIGVIEEAQRWYPWGSTANQIIGWVDSEGAGQYGLEARYDRELRGVPGYVRAEFTLRNTPIQNTIETMVPSAPGQTLVLTLDAALQRLFEDHLATVRAKHDARRALAIAIDIHTGGILAYAMTPGADLNDRSTWLGPTGELDFTKLTNWGAEPMPPGSIFKAITIAAALEENKIHPNSVFEDSGLIVVDDWTIQNWDKATYDYNPLTVYELMQRSSNIGLIKIGQTMGRDTFVKYLEGFGLLEPTGLDMVGEGWPNVGDPFEEKYAVDFANMYIGQHLEYTPIQILTAWAAIANGGYLVQPHFVQEIRDPEGQVIQQFGPVRKRQVISEQTSAQVRDILISVLKEGTGRAAVPAGYTAGGKTGTADKFDEHGSMMERQLADFVGFAPAENPQVAILIMVDEPLGQGYGGMVAAPEFAYLLPHVMRTIGIAPNSDAATGEETAPPAAENGVVPDVRYLPPVWARERLAAAGFTVKVTGEGTVVGAQSETPGALAKAGTEIELKLLPREQQVEGKVFVPDLIGYSLAEAHQIAAELGFTLRSGGSGFVAHQEIPAGATVPVRGAVNVRLAPR